MKNTWNTYHRQLSGEIMEVKEPWYTWCMISFYMHPGNTKDLNPITEQIFLFKMQNRYEDFHHVIKLQKIHKTPQATTPK